MKKQLHTFALILAPMLLLGCSKNPQDTLVEFNDLFASGDKSKVVKAVDFLYMNSEEKNEFIKGLDETKVQSLKDFKFVVKKCETPSSVRDTDGLPSDVEAAVECFVVDKNGQSDEVHLFKSKANGWQVFFP